MSMLMSETDYQAPRSVYPMTMVGAPNGAVTFFLSFALWLISAVLPASALDPAKAPPNNSPANVFVQNPLSPQQALIAALRAFPEPTSPKPAPSLEALQYAADNGQPMAQWRLGRMYAIGEFVAQDDAKAYDYFSRIVEGYDEESADSSDAALVSNAFVAIGVYSLHGIAGAHIKPDVNRAITMFKYAASNFGNADAQYNLARIYLDGVGVPRDLMQAAKWLRLAAEKNHVEAEAVLGNLLFFGGEGLGRQRARGLMWLRLAKKMAVNNQDQWIVSLCDTLDQQASDNDRHVAEIYMEERQKHAN